jgi:CO/xanthine dehydrogenase FAD-binding subunit
MIVEYFRPKNIPETLDLLSNPHIQTVLMGGGTAIERYGSEPIGVVDLQDVGLNDLSSRGKKLEIGATVTLQTLLEHNQIQDALKKTIHLEAGQNLRQVATVAGALVASDGRSPFTTAMLALDASLTSEPGDEQVSLGNMLALRQESLENRLITKITLGLNAQFAYEYVARTPADRPIACAAVAVWPSGRTRVALGGYGSAPLLAMDGPEKDGAEETVRDAYSLASDQWAAAEYRQETVVVLVRRCLANLDTEIKVKD